MAVGTNHLPLCSTGRCGSEDRIVLTCVGNSRCRSSRLWCSNALAGTTLIRPVLLSTYIHKDCRTTMVSGRIPCQPPGTSPCEQARSPTTRGEMKTCSIDRHEQAGCAARLVPRTPSLLEQVPVSRQWKRRPCMRTGTRIEVRSTPSEFKGLAEPTSDDRSRYFCQQLG